MEIDDDTLRHFTTILNLLVEMTRDKLVFQALAIPFLGDKWQEIFQNARLDRNFLGQWELNMAEIEKMRKDGMEMLDQLRKGLPVRLPDASIN